MTRLRFTSDELNQRVLQVINNIHPTQTNRLSREAISMAIYDHFDTSTDRKIRDAINELRKLGHPIISSADKAGYWFDPASVGVVIADLRSRIADMSDTIRALEKGYMPEKPEQMSLGV